MYPERKQDKELQFNRPFSSCCEPRYKREAKCRAFHMKISFVYKGNENFTLSLAFTMRFNTTMVCFFYAL